MIKGLNAMLLCDMYKILHREQYPENTEVVYSTWTPRANTHAPNGIDKVVAFGFQGFIKEFLIDFFNDEFFGKDKEVVVAEYARMLKFSLGIESPETQHIEDLHDLGYLPLRIKAVPEGTRVPLKVPMMTVENTDKRFFWLTNYIETLASSNLWKGSTNATIALEYRKILNEAALETTGSIEGVEFQGHDFSMRGMSGLEDAARSSAGHLLSFVGTDTIPAINYIEQYYNGDIEKELIGCSVAATEHSVMSSGSKEGEFETYKRIIEDLYPAGIVSIVSDTWDLWHVLGDTIPKLKESIMNRNSGVMNKVVIRPDSGDPADILCGNPKADKNSLAFKGVIEALWDIFGGTITDQGYKVLDSHIGAIYGDSITLERCQNIVDRLKAKGFASTNTVLGIGSFTYQYNTRDTFGFAMKSTSVTINGKERAIFKDPITDDWTKKSAKGRVAVVSENNKLKVIDNLSLTSKIEGDILATIFENGKLVKEVSFQGIKEELLNAANV